MPPSLESLRPPHTAVRSNPGHIPGSPIPGLMQHHDLLIIDLLQRASTLHPHTEVVSRLSELPPSSPPHRLSYSSLYSRVQRLAHALTSPPLLLRMGDTIGTVAFNSHRHVELYYAVSGVGAIVHTVNPRLFDDQLAYIIAHAQDTVLFIDHACVPLISRLLTTNKLPPDLRFVILTDEAHMPTAVPPPIPGALCYETLLAAQPDTFVFPRFDEHTASSLCYTSGTTGQPRGVLFSHRSTVLHSMGVALDGSIGFSNRDVVLLVVPMFHVNGWGMPYTAALMGMKMVFPGVWLDGDSVCRMMREERCTVTLGVPSVTIAHT